ncbi:hypothetical protein BEE12_21655 (plasmid) [Pantoea agglomerans]|nr:hypothetical protein BEE12_21655 [Pantoea agglomerans]TKJ58308.1 hypothetical protein PagCFBP13505_07140 [Pantoea agglomerans]TKK18693.1 hypothetical protein PagCFBP13516_12880 [Pantoea agglomerans]TKK30049.1 hypothetical protein PagCFBP13532_17900 [Pantoea agglomerans]
MSPVSYYSALNGRQPHSNLKNYLKLIKEKLYDVLIFRINFMLKPLLTIDKFSALSEAEYIIFIFMLLQFIVYTCDYLILVQRLITLLHKTP